MRLVIFVLIMIIFLSSSIAEENIKIKSETYRHKEEYVPNELLVKFKTGVLPKEVEDILQEFEADEIDEIGELEIRHLKIPSGIQVSDMVKKFKKNPLIEFAEPNYIAYASMTPDDPYYSYQWNFDNPDYGGIHMESAWDITTGASSIIVAVIDTGVAYENYCESKPRKCYYQAPDLAGTSFVAGYDFINNDAHPNDDESHGTHVTGTIAQTTNNNLGVAGIAFNTSIMPVKVLDSTGSGTYEQVANGIIYAVDNGADVISMSLGGSSPSTTLENAVNYAYDNGAIIIAACGNANIASCDYPAAYNNVIAVGATQYDETRAPYSNYGPQLDLVAPGGNTNVDQNGDGYGDGILQNTFNPQTKNTQDFGYWFFQGTSMATPHVSGVAALLLAKNPFLTHDQIRNVLQTTAEDLGDPGRDDTYGYGLVDAFAAVNEVEFISITLIGYPLDFGSLDYGTTNNPAIGNPLNQYKIRVDSETTVNVDLYQKGNDFNNNGNLISSDNVLYNNNNTVEGAIQLNNTYGTAFLSNISPGTENNVYYWITIPDKQGAGNYNSTIYIKALGTGT